MNKSLLPFSRDSIKILAKKALDEDTAFNDITSLSVINPRTKAVFKIIFKEDGIVCGIDFVREIFLAVDNKTVFNALKKDGEFVKKNSAVAEISGLAQSILSAERTALNFLGHLSGIATLTREFAEAAPNIKITDTRKTLPFLREIQKYAVRSGGGVSHRMNLAEQFLIKDNHLDILKSREGVKDYIKLAIARIKAGRNKKKIEIETRNLKEFKEALESKPDIIMLDNMSIGQIKKAVLLRNKTNPLLKIEVSGKMTVSKVKKSASLGIDYISIGMLTHSSKSIDVSLTIIQLK
ncbi:MAG: carboxylating nicotinate-nucleotide diphosphorylase [Candidatus Omnitrophota bacterium]